MGLPARTPSKSGDVIFRPAADITSFTGMNLSRGSRISYRGLGTKSAFALVTTDLSRFATTILAPCFNTPSKRLTLAEGQRLISSLTSSTIPLQDLRAVPILD